MRSFGRFFGGALSKVWEERLIAAHGPHLVRVQYRLFLHPVDAPAGWSFTIGNHLEASFSLGTPLRSEFHWLIAEEFYRHVGQPDCWEILRQIVKMVGEMDSAQDPVAVCPCFLEHPCEQHPPSRWSIDELAEKAYFGPHITRCSGCRR